MALTQIGNRRQFRVVSSLEFSPQNRDQTYGPKAPLPDSQSWELEFSQTGGSEVCDIANGYYFNPHGARDLGCSR